MNLAVAVNDASIEAVKATQASVIHDMNERRGVPPLADEPPAEDFAAVGFAGAVGPFGAAGGVIDGFAGAGSCEVSLLIGISHNYKVVD